MKLNSILMGYSIEFHRLYGKKGKEIPIQEYLNKDEIPICHRDTYMKIIKGENQSTELYEQIMEKNQLQFDFDYPLYEQTKKTHKMMKNALEVYDVEALENSLEKGKELLTYKKDVYPHKIEYFILEKTYDSCIQRIFFSDKEVSLLCYLLDFVSRDLQIIMIHMLYFDCHRRKSTVSSLRKIMNVLPVNQHEILYHNIMIRQMIYEKEFQRALLLVQQLDTICQETNNISRLCEVQQYYMAIYSSIGKSDEFKMAKKRLKQILESGKVAPTMQDLADYYLGMCAFTDHDFIEAKHFFEKQMVNLKEKTFFNIKLFYCCVLSYLNEENKMFSVQGINMNELKASEKVFIRYFMMKDKRRSNKTLIQYILTKIMPIINVDFEMEAGIFLQELYLLEATQEQILIFEYQLSKTNCVIFQDWRERFSN